MTTTATQSATDALNALRDAPDAAAVNAGLEAAGSDRWLCRCGAESTQWQHMRLAEVDGWPAGFAEARQTVVEAAIEDARWL